MLSLPLPMTLLLPVLPIYHFNLNLSTKNGIGERKTPEKKKRLIGSGK